MNTRKNALLITLVGVLVLGLIGWTVAKRFGKEPQDPDQSALAIADDATKDLEQGAPPASFQTGSISPDDPGSVLAKPADPAQQQQENERVLAEFERQHRAEPIDTAWAGKAEPTLAKIITNDGIVVSNIDPVGYRADCRSETCRISANFKTYADAEDWGTMYITMTGETFHRTNSMVLPQPDGTAELRIYGHRRR